MMDKSDMREEKKEKSNTDKHVKKKDKFNKKNFFQFGCPSLVDEITSY